MEAQIQNANVTPVTGDINRTGHPVEPRLRSPLLAIAPGPTRVLRSSMSLPWQGILLEKHFSSPGERRSASIDKHVISMFDGAPCRFEHRSPSGGFVPVLNGPRAIMMTPAGPVPDIRLHTSAELTHCALESGFVRSVADELDHPAGSPVFHAGVEEKSIQRILRLLMDEISPTGLCAGSTSIRSPMRSLRDTSCSM